MKRHAINSLARFFALASCAFALCSCADMFQERVSMQPTDAGTTLTSLFTSTKTIEKLDAPAQIFATSGEYSDRIVVSWEAVEGAASYCLERAVSSSKDADGNWIAPDEGEYESLEHSKFIEGTSFTDTIIDNTPANILDYTNDAYSAAYFYRVFAENAIKNYESSDFAYSGCGTLLAPPSNVKASCGASKTKISVTWNRAAGSIASYRIYRSANSDGSGASQVGTVYGNSSGTDIDISTEQQGVSFYFTVVSVAAGGNESVSSSVAMGYTLKEGAPGQVQGVEVTEGRGDTNGKVCISWEKAAGTGTINYRVYRYSSADSTLKQLKDNADKTQTAYEDTTNLKPNLFYYYQIQAWVEKDGEEVLGQISDSGDDSDNPAEGYLLSPPQSVVVQKISGNYSQNKIVFSAAIGSADSAFNSAATTKKADFNSYTYVVYGNDSATGTFSEVASFSSPSKSGQSGYYEESVADYKFYKMVTKNGSAASAESSVVAPAPFAAGNCVVTKNAAIDGYTNDDANANANGVHAIKITWTAPTGGADGGYNIYRSTKPDSGFKKITETPVTELAYVYNDGQAKAGNYYYYRVLSLNSLGQGANYSNTDYGYGALTTYQYTREYIKTTLNSQKKLTLMHKSGNTDKLGSESANGDISGTLSYEAKISGVSGRVIMHYDNYADYYIMDDSSLGVYFLLNGNTNTSAGIDTNGTMDGTVTVQGMYPGSVVYDNIKIKGGAAGGGTYGVTRTGIDASAVQADWTWGEK